jgi:hypothetical protein
MIEEWLLVPLVIYAVFVQEEGCLEAHWLDMLCCCNFIIPKVTYDLIMLSKPGLEFL